MAKYIPQHLRAVAAAAAPAPATTTTTTTITTTSTGPAPAPVAAPVPVPVPAPAPVPAAAPPAPPATFQSPPHNNFLNWPYNVTRANKKNWSTALKNYRNNTSITNQDKLNRIQSYYTKVSSQLPLSYNFYKKKIALENRKKELLGKAYQQILFDERAGCVIVFSDDKALYTVAKDTGKYGFPKGEIEFILPDPTRIASVIREDSVTAALRELKEETGFYLSAIPVPKDTIQPFAANLHREVNGVIDPKHYTVNSVKKYTSKKKNYYLILFLNESSTAPGPDISTLTPNAIQENITRYIIENQCVEKTKYKYNAFSQIKFTKTKTYHGGSTRKRKQQKSRKRRSTIKRFV